MASNRRRHANAVPLALIATWILVLGAVGVAGLGYVYLKNEIHVTGAKIKSLENELAKLNTQDEVMRAKIAVLSSHDAMKRRLSEGFIKLVPVSDDRLVRVDVSSRKDVSELRAVSNERLAE
ncbi:MAG: hypothetical protein JWL90_4714 [Chthoniobacteraceae bacterium]|nr:hypothetical protein [Chthoniobacteraceae bacterium]